MLKIGVCGRSLRRDFGLAWIILNVRNCLACGSIKAREKGKGLGGSGGRIQVRRQKKVESLLASYGSVGS